MSSPEKPFERPNNIEIPEIIVEEMTVQDLNDLPLHICAEGCGCSLVYPVRWDEVSYDEETDQATWDVTLRCPNCEFIRDGEFDDFQVGELEDKLTDDVAWLLLALKRFSEANMSEDVERFVYALNHDAIQPMDF